MKTNIGWLVGVLAAVVGCSDSPEDCVDRYESGPYGDSYETTCATPVSPPGSGELDGVELAAGDCVESFATSCSFERGCEEIYSRRCANAAANVESTVVGQLEQSLLLDDCQIDNGEHTVTALRTIPEPYASAIPAINRDFLADGDDVGFLLRPIQSRGPQGSLDVRQLVIDDVASDSDSKTGVTSCIRDGATGDRGRCAITIFRGTIRRFSEETGNDQSEVELVTAMHEFGHTFCLEHKNVDSDSELTPMNSHHVLDTDRPQLAYAGYLDSERDEVRSILRNP